MPRSKNGGAIVGPGRGGAISKMSGAGGVGATFFCSKYGACWGPSSRTMVGVSIVYSLGLE